MGNGRSTSALHAPVGTAASAQSQERKRERRLRRALGCSAPAQRLAPSRAASPAPVSSASPLCGVLGQQHPPSSSWAQPCLAVTMALWADYLAMGFVCCSEESETPLCSTTCSQVGRARAPGRVRTSAPMRKAHACPSAARAPPARPCSAPARTPQTGSMLKTALFFGFFVCFEFIQSLRNLWFGWKFKKQNKTKQRNHPPWQIAEEDLAELLGGVGTEAGTTFKEKETGGCSF